MVFADYTLRTFVFILGNNVIHQSASSNMDVENQS